MAHRQWSQDQIGFYYYNAQLSVFVPSVFSGCLVISRRLNFPNRLQMIQLTPSNPLFNLVGARLRLNSGYFFV